MRPKAHILFLGFIVFGILTVALHLTGAAVERASQSRATYYMSLSEEDREWFDQCTIHKSFHSCQQLQDIREQRHNRFEVAP